MVSAKSLLPPIINGWCLLVAVKINLVVFRLDCFGLQDPHTVESISFILPSLSASAIYDNKRCPTNFTNLEMQ